MKHYSARVRRILDQARELGQWYGGQPDAASLCFDVFADHSGCHAAQELIYRLFCDEWLIYDNRNAIQQNIDEWDDRPWQQRRRLALSFRFMSRWETRYGDAERSEQRTGQLDVADLLREAKMQLLHAYCLGDDEGANYAWPLFEHAIARSATRQLTLLWVARLYTDLGFFADAAEALYEYCAVVQDDAARRLLVEVVWWRDNGHRLPWLPPSGDGSRYRRMMNYIDPSAPASSEASGRMRAEALSPGNAPPRCAPSISVELADLISAAVPEISTLPASEQFLVDWSFLDFDEGLPGELPGWAKKMLQRYPGNVPEAMLHRYRWSRPIPRPRSVPHHNLAHGALSPDEFSDTSADGD